MAFALGSPDIESLDLIIKWASSFIPSRIENKGFFANKKIDTFDKKYSRVKNFEWNNNKTTAIKQEYTIFNIATKLKAIKTYYWEQILNLFFFTFFFEENKNKILYWTKIYAAKFLLSFFHSDEMFCNVWWEE